ncbi:OLC1v1008845C1 [Oldenlandia corymbosa var. corymbosa]|uniref:OLC1v1008845C1 n=1 Tax=Oldenlandia corymbosa var. corymbosa TaxID=529605 RepID=A0AAV1DMK4_OLDCO|nr:OLC1v1008845C1 [Oldenlandia corymbosa var. corymbosa]
MMNMGQPPELADMMMGQKLQPTPMISSSSSSSISVSSSPQIISFGNPTSSTDPSNSDHDHTFYYAYNSKKTVDSPDNYLASYNWSCKTSPTRKNSQQAQCHVEAERKRREKLSALFVSLTKVVPGLKKLDKISVLEDAIKHMIELQERLKVLEEEVKKNTKIILDVDADDDDHDEDHDVPIAEELKGILPTDIKVKMLGKNVLVKILCDKRYYGCILNLSNELQNLHLTLLDTRVLLFGGCAIDITFAAQMESHFSATVSGIIKHLQNAMFQIRK